jgi:small multidrug resistance pump
MRVPPYALLAITIVAEVIAASALRASEGFSRLLPAVIVVLGYGVAFYCLSLTLRSIPVGIVYAIWSGAGIVLISLSRSCCTGRYPICRPSSGYAIHYQVDGRADRSACPLHIQNGEWYELRSAPTQKRRLVQAA